MLTPYHSQYYAYELTKRSASDSIAKLGPSLFNAQVDLNPHQLDAALFAFRSPLSRGAILADEVGLGKTIEAGLIISQLWAERKRRVLVIAPTILRKQWAQELADKFHIPSRVLDSREYHARRRAGDRPLEPADSVVICSYHFARSYSGEIGATPWDLVVIDEAHRLRNVYKPGNKIATAIKSAVGHRPLLLLTATPLQNSLLELYGLVSFLDEHLFGDIEAFRARYMRGTVEQRQLAELRQRLRPVCQRTLRRQVTEYVRFTNRIPVTQDFTPTADEQALYDLVTTYLQRETLHALPASQRKLTTLVLRKLLASSTYAIAGTFRQLAERLKRKHAEVEELLEADYEGYGELSDEWTAESDDESTPEEEIDLDAAVRAEIEELTAYGDLAASITTNAKGQALLQALDHGFSKLAELGARRKAVIFTESRRTQAYLIDLLNANGFGGRVLTINGTNTDDRAGEIYRAWVERHRGEEVVTGNKTVDLRAALVEHFRDHAEILIATEAAAEGVNLQFCSLVVNYDLPWNPQRIEQRIGRCHRYGQAHDVVVINFLNRANAADQRVFELLSEKFRLFEGIFGSSDEVLGALESGVDFERRIAEIYQECRTPDEIDAAFSELQQDLEEQISARMSETRTALLENFDEEVHRRLRMSLEDSRACLDHLERCLWNLTRHELDGAAEFDEGTLTFDLQRQGPDWPNASLGCYQFVTRTRQRNGHIPYRLGHPLAEAALRRARERTLPPVRTTFHYSAYPGRIGLLEGLKGRSGWLTLARLTVSSLENEDRLLVAVMDDNGTWLHPDVGEKLFLVGGNVEGTAEPSAEVEAALQRRLAELETRALTEIQQRNSRFFDEEIEKLDRWADDLKHGLEVELKEVDAEIRQARKDAKLAPDLEGKLALHRTIRDLEARRAKKRRELYEAQDEIDGRKEELISGVEARLQQAVEVRVLFTLEWRIQ
ncbi:MAG: SNF2-related protein [Armatimonadota bacterium]